MREITYAEAIREALSIEMRRDEAVFMMGEDIGVYGGAFGVSVGMIEEFGPERIRDTPISEAAIVGAAIGAAVTGMRPVAEIQFSDFITIGMDQLVNQAAKMRYMFGGKAKVPMVLRAPAGSGTGAAGQHSSSMEAWYAHVPGLKVVIPSSPGDAKGLLASAIADDNPVVFLEQKLLYRRKGEVPEEPYSIPLSQSVVKRPGHDITIVTWGRMVERCLEVAEKMTSKLGIEIIDPRTLMPLDEAPIVESVKKTGRLLIVHEAVQTGGFGGEIAARVADSEAFYYLDAPIRRLGGLDVPIPYNPTLEANVVPTPEAIIEAVQRLMKAGPWGASGLASGLPAASGPASGPASGLPAASRPASGPGDACGPSSGLPAASGPASGPGGASGPASGLPAASGPASGPGDASGSASGTSNSAART